MYVQMQATHESGTFVSIRSYQVCWGCLFVFDKISCLFLTYLGVFDVLQVL